MNVHLILGILLSTILLHGCQQPSVAPNRRDEVEILGRQALLDEDCALFGYATTTVLRDYTQDCAPNPFEGGLTRQATVWFNCRKEDQSVVGRGVRWSQCLNGLVHPTNGEAERVGTVSCFLVGGLCVIRAGGLADVQTRVGSETPEGLLLRALFGQIETARERVTTEGGPTLEQRLLLIDASSLFAEVADTAFFRGDSELGVHTVSLAERILDVATDFAPGVSFVKDAAIVLTGRNPITGEVVSDVERALTAASLLIPTFASGGAKAFTRAVSHLDELAALGKPVSHYADDLSQAVARGDTSLAENVPNLPCLIGASGNASQSVQVSTPPCKKGEVTAAVAEVASSTLSLLRSKQTGFGTSVRLDYAKTFREHYPQYSGDVAVVHHAVEQQVLSKYPGVVAETEMHSLENLRGIPKGSVGADIHLSKIRGAWDAFYVQMATMGRAPTKSELLVHAKAIDDLYGKMFIPRVR